MIKRFVLAVAALAGILASTSCVDKEMDDLSKAQECLNNVSETSPTSATSCLQYTSGYDSLRANILKCSIYITSGGLVTSRLKAAYQASTDASVTNKEGAYIAYLALDLPDSATGYATAQTALPYCNATGNAGLIFVANIAVMGSWANSLFDTSTGNPIDFSDPSAVDAAIDTVVDSCQTNPPAASCDPEIIGPAAVAIANAYCSSPSADSNVCATINDAVGTGGDNDKITQGLMCLLSGKSWDPDTNTCT